MLVRITLHNIMSSLMRSGRQFFARRPSVHQTPLSDSQSQIVCSIVNSTLRTLSGCLQIYRCLSNSDLDVTWILQYNRNNL